MAYIGRGIENFSQIEVLDLITFTNSAGPYNITKDSVAFVPSTVNSLLIEVDGIIQAPASYTISGSTITFGASMPSTSTMNSMIHFGTGLITTPADGSVTAAKIASDAVTTAKILDNNVTVAKLPTTLDISGNTVTLPASVSGLGTGITNAQLAGSIDVTSKITGVVPSANLGSGTGSSANFLRGDSSWQEVATGTSWQSVVTASTLTAVAGNGYPINTTSNACTVTLPAAASVGDTIEFTDYARTWGTNTLTINQNSLNYQGNTSPNPVYDTAGESIRIVYMDATKGWIPTYDGAVALETSQWGVDYLVIAGGGGGGRGNTCCSYSGGGGGAGGYRASWNSEASGGGGGSESQETQTTGTEYTITVGAGGAAAASANSEGSVGVDSSFIGTGISITSAGGGYGAAGNTGTLDGGNGGSGGGCKSSQTPGSGTANQGFDGGTGIQGNSGGGGGGAGAVGGDGVADNYGGPGGAGVASTITGSSLSKAGGGGGASSLGSAPAGGTGGGGDGGYQCNSGTSGTANTGSGGGAGTCDGSTAGAGGTGVVILRMNDANYSSSTGSPTVATGQGAGSNETILTFTGDGTYTTT